MPRQHLLAALSSARVDPALTWTIMQLHTHAMMKFTYAGNCAQIETLNGIRQGCGLAPTLWSMFTAIIMHKLLEKLSVEEIVAFADDWLFQWVINKEADLVRAVELVGFILDVLKSFGMQPSLDKTVVLVSLKGSSAQRILRRYITASPKKGKLLQVRTAEGQVSLPITHQHTYLGVQIGYSRVEDATLRFRVKQSWIVFNRLLPSLRCAGLPRDLKVSVWKACAYASLVYGLDCIALSPSGAAKLRKVVARQLRLALKAPVFITRENTETFLNRLSIPNPILDVAQRTQTRLQKCQHNDMHVLQPIRTQQRWRHLLAASQSTCDLYSFQQIARSLPAAEVQARLVEVSATLPKQACPHCGVYFDSRKSLRQHISQKHKNPSSQFTCKDPPKRTQQQKRHDYMQFASDGVPTCKFCNWHFSAWPAFFEHFECKRCPLFPSEATLLQDTPEASNAARTPLTSATKPQGTSSMPQTVPSEQTGSFASLFQQLPSDIRTLCHDGWEQLAAKVRIIDQHACPFCNQWLASPAYLSRHIAKQHVMLKPVMQKLSSWLEERRPTVFSPCQWCHRDFKAQNCSRARHVAACPTLIRTGIYVLLSRAQDPSGADGSGDECGAGGGPDQREGASSSAPGHDGQRSGCSPGHGSHGSSSGTGPDADSGPVGTLGSFGKPRNGYLQPGQARTGAWEQETGHGKGRDKYRRFSREKGNGYGTGWGAKGHHQDWWSQDKTKSNKEKDKHSPEQEEVKALCISMSRLLLRHEDQQSIDRSEKGFILFCQARGMLSIIPDLTRTLETWAKLKEEQPTTLTLPQRAAMLQQMVKIWHTRLEAVTASEESKEQAQKMLILNPDGTVPYLQYNRQEQQMEVKKDREPMEYAEVMKLLVELQDLVLLPLSTQRFHAARKSAMTPGYKGEIVPMMLEVGLRTPEADRTWSILARLSHSGACRAIAATMRQERLGRSALAKLIQQQAESLSAP